LVLLARGAAQSLFATLFPANCRLCESPLSDISRLPVCEHCLQTVLPIGCKTCCLCGEGLESGFGASRESVEPLCGLCRRLKPPFARAAAYGSYEGVLRDLIHLLKYERVRPASAVLGNLLVRTISRLAPSFGDSPVLLIPVPLYPKKLRQRGFNQAELAARAALQRMPAGAGLTLESRVLKRERATQSQVGLTRHQRRQNIRGAFAVHRRELITGRELLLVDDVFTTGTTVSECTRVLLQAGASKVWVATVARTLKASLSQSGLGNRNLTKMAAAA
jgi:ComF family protein